jgi:peptidoglycan/xylan/chitin deacetylase (PgdA/CDA1 family)
MPWKEGYTISDEVGRQDVEWPEGNRCAVTIVVDCSVVGGTEGITEEDIAKHEAQFGADVGMRRIFELLESHALKATFAVPAVIAEAFPENAKEIAQRGHEVAAHGLRHEDVTQLEREEELARIRRTGQILADVSGQRPVGWYSLPRQGDRYPGGQISPNTVDLLIEEGYAYLGNSMADDIPHYWVTDFASRKNLLAMPYYYHFDDLFFLLFPAPGGGTGLENPETLYSNWVQEFDAVYQIGRQFTAVVHPYLIAWGHRTEIIENLFRHVRGFPDVWNPTVSECARYWEAKYPAGSSLQLEESIWKDYPGSLS